MTASLEKTAEEGSGPKDNTKAIMMGIEVPDELRTAHEENVQKYFHFVENGQHYHQELRNGKDIKMCIFLGAMIQEHGLGGISNLTRAWYIRAMNKDYPIPIIDNQI